MGLIISKFRKQKTTIEILEEIEKSIAIHQRFRRQNQEYQKNFIGSLILYSVIIYVVAAVLFFIFYFPQSWKDWLFASIPLLLFPILIWLVKKVVHWYLVKRISSNEVALQELQDKKKDILEDVMENETYKKAKEILKRFDPSQFKKLEVEKPAEGKSGTVVRQRIVTTRTMSPVMRMPNPVQPMSAPHPHQRSNPSVGSMQMISQMNGRQMSMVPPGYGLSPGPPMPRPVPPRERKTLDKFVDYLVGEGPQNRYALICRYCHSHNGMAMKEEFEYISFRCCYCYHLNPAKKQRPHAPRLDFPTPQSSPARRAITAPDSKSNGDKESSGEEDNLSANSEKSDDESKDESKDETIETETKVEGGMEEEVSESVENADNVPMADEIGKEENADEGVEKQVEDEMQSEIKQDESALTQDITEGLEADNQLEAETTIGLQEHHKDD
ncbi:LNPK [Acanthosepion pharaonis]|uniref:Endoplasmic reticulum junction formation protein lunapark n=1 Tax=Acanthosepion pharaonis TaxID=158019 RepID=A0A812DJ95_ACAPH|nr:LNPK [Sepia pharaonis]